MKIKREVRDAWADALESGRYKQGRGQLVLATATGEKKWCCLGVLCDLAIKAGAPDVTEADGGPAFGYIDTSAPESGPLLAHLPASVMKWAGIIDDDAEDLYRFGDLKLPTHDDNRWISRRWAANINDRGTSFTQIAAAIRELPVTDDDTAAVTDDQENNGD